MGRRRGADLYKVNVEGNPANVVIIDYKIHFPESRNVASQEEFLADELSYTAVDEEVSDPRSGPEYSIICSRLPPVDDGYGCTECILENVMAQRFPASLSAPRSPTYSENVVNLLGDGLSAKRAFQKNDIIFVQRPILLFPYDIAHNIRQAPPLPIGVRDAMVELAYRRMSNGHKGDFRSYPFNAVGPSYHNLLGITMQNSIILKGGPFMSVVDKSRFEMMEAVGYDTNVNRYYMLPSKTFIRIKRSFIPNCCMEFDRDSLTLSLRAVTAIDQGKELVCSDVSHF